MISTERSIAMTDQPRRVLTPGSSRKRKEREEGLHKLKPSTTITTKTNPGQDPAPAPALNSDPNPNPGPTPVRPSSNRVLAGYLAHEFLTRGTLFGQKWDPSPAKVDRTEPKKVAEKKGGEKEMMAAVAQQSYPAVAELMKMDGTHIPGIVNPTQLARWIENGRKD